mmetsp:Transcript_31345/g.30866  ORF Transcript_31345/g.30866 Transcript_31345/m.30866 type:complete len:125 (-) Transcript_31345:117-491(-)
MDFVNVFKSDEFQSSPDIAVIGFQETLTLNALNCLKGHDKGRVEALKSHAEDALDDLDPEARYQFVAQSPMVGLLLMVFVKENLKGRIKDISTSKVKSGFGGNVGNKGAVMVRFNLDKTSICLC